MGSRVVRFQSGEVHTYSHHSFGKLRIIEDEVIDEKVRKLFEKADFDASGLLGVEEAMEALIQFKGLEWSANWSPDELEKYVQKLFDEEDSSGDGQLNLHEFNRLLQRVKGPERLE